MFAKIVAYLPNASQTHYGCVNPEYSILPSKHISIKQVDVRVTRIVE